MFAMSKILEAVTGVCLSSVWKGLTSGVVNFGRASAAASRSASSIVTRDLASIPSVLLEDLLGDRKLEIWLPIDRHIDGALPAHQAIILYSLLVAEQPKVVLEIGTYNGHTTRAMATNLPEAIIHTVDLPPDFAQENDPVKDLQKDDFHLIAKRKVGRDFLDTPQASRIRQHFSDSAVFDFKQAEGATFFFIDGSHTYEYCKSDSEKAFELCGGKGIFVWHDCNDDHPGVVKFIREWRQKGRDIVRINGTCVAYWKNL